MHRLIKIASIPLIAADGIWSQGSSSYRKTPPLSHHSNLFSSHFGSHEDSLTLRASWYNSEKSVDIYNGDLSITYFLCNSLWKDIRGPLFDVPSWSKWTRYSSVWPFSWMQMNDLKDHGDVPFLSVQLSCVIWEICGGEETSCSDEPMAFLFSFRKIS